jgi:superfamily II DNA/RNA helicase
LYDIYRRSLISCLHKTLSLSALDSLVIDEADLILSYGHDEDIRQIFGGGFLPKVYQSFLMSATMTDDVEKLKGLTLRNPVRSTNYFFYHHLDPNDISAGHLEVGGR